MDASAKDLLVVGVDFSGPSLAAAHYGASLSARLDARVLLLHVVTPDATPRADESYVRAKHSVDVHTDATRRLSQLAQELSVTHVVPVAFRVCRGRPSDVIVMYAEQAFMLLMGTRGITAEQRDVIGSVVGQVVRRSETPVLTIHEDGSLARVA